MVDSWLSSGCACASCIAKTFHCASVFHCIGPGSAGQCTADSCIFPSQANPGTSDHGDTHLLVGLRLADVGYSRRTQVIKYIRQRLNRRRVFFLVCILTPTLLGWQPVAQLLFALHPVCSSFKIAICSLHP